MLEQLYCERDNFDGFVVKIGRQSKKIQIQGAQILRNEVYLLYAAVTKDAVERRSWTFDEVVNCFINMYGIMRAL